MPDINAINGGLLSGTSFVESPNQSDRSGENVIDLLIIHNISLPPGQYGNGCVDQLFCNSLDSSKHPFFEEIAELRVSAHLLIDRLGDVTQFVPFCKKAWHAGDSEFEDRPNCNDYSVGIELEGTDFEPFTDEQYQSLLCVTKLLLQEYPALIQIELLVIVMWLQGEKLTRARILTGQNFAKRFYAN
jgi:AmpD protein